MWVRLDDAYYDHNKVVAAGPVAELLWVRALAWANRNRTRNSDGIVPTGVVYRLADFAGRMTLDGESASPLDLAAVLVREHLWVPVPGGFAIHDYQEYQRTLDEIDELAAKRSAAGRKGAESRWAKDGNGHSSGMASATAGAEQSDWPADAPVPVPDGSLPSVGDVTQEGYDPAALIDDEVWREYARLKRDGIKVRSIVRYDAKTIENAKADLELVAKATRWLSDFDVTPREVAAALVDGKAGHTWTRREETA